MTRLSALSALSTIRSLAVLKKPAVFCLLAGFMISAYFVLSAHQALAVDEPSSPTIKSPLKWQEFATPMPRISGEAQGADEVLVFIDNSFNGIAKVKDNKFDYSPFLPLSSGDHDIVVRARDSKTKKSSETSFPVAISIIPNPSPTLLVPSQGARAGQDRVWVGGVARNDSLVRILVDGVERERVNVKNHVSGVGSFGVEIKGLSTGIHTMNSVARDKQGKESFSSNVLVIEILPPTPAPVLSRPVVNADSGIERPFIVGFAKNNLEVSIVIDGKISYRLPLGVHPSGVMSFAWQPGKPLTLGNHKIEAFASDRGKLSNNSKPVYWQVGEVALAPEGLQEEQIGAHEEAGKKDEAAKAGDGPQTIVETDKGELVVVGEEGRDLVVSEGDQEKPLTVKQDLEPFREDPVVPDDLGEEHQEQKQEGRIIADDDLVLGESSGPDELSVADEGEVTELAPGAVVRKTGDSAEERGEFTLNTSLIIGIVILVFLLLSILIWYIQEKRSELGEKVVNIFREDDEGGPDDKFGSGVTTPKDSPKESASRDAESSRTDSTHTPDYDFGAPEPKSEPPKEEKWRDRPEDFPPPPPPMF